MKPILLLALLIFGSELTPEISAQSPTPSPVVTIGGATQFVQPVVLIQTSTTGSSTDIVTVGGNTQQVKAVCVVTTTNGGANFSPVNSIPSTTGTYTGFIAGGLNDGVGTITGNQTGTWTFGG